MCCWLDIPTVGSVDGAFNASDGLCQPTSLASSILTFEWNNLPSDQLYETYARCRATTGSLTISEPTGLKGDGEVEDYRVRFDFTPTAVTLGKVKLESVSLSSYLMQLGDLGDHQLHEMLLD